MPPLALVIENDEGTQRLLQVLLQRQGFEVDAVRSGSDALLLVRRIPYSVIVLDLMLPQVDGLALLTMFRAEMPHVLRRTIVVSSAPQHRLEQLAIEFSEVPQIRKPFEIDTFTMMVERHAQREGEPLLAFDDHFCRDSVRIHAKSGVLVRLSNRTLHVAASFGYAGNDLDAFFPLSVDAQLPICAAARGQEVWYPSLTNLGNEYPLLLPIWKEHRSNALAALPVEHGGAIIGAIGWSFGEPQTFRPADREPLAALAAIAAEHLLAGGEESNTA